MSQTSNQTQTQEDKRWYKLGDLIEFDTKGELKVRLTDMAKELLKGFNNFIAKVWEEGNVIAISLSDLDENVDIVINKNYCDCVFIVDEHYEGTEYYVVPFKKLKELNIVYIEFIDEEPIFNVIVDPSQGKEFLVYRVTE